LELELRGWEDDCFELTMPRGGPWARGVRWPSSASSSPQPEHATLEVWILEAPDETGEDDGQRGDESSARLPP